MIKSVVTAVFPGIVGDFAVKNPHLCVKVDVPFEGIGWSTTISHLKASNRLVIVPINDEVIGALVSTGEKFVLVYPNLEEYGISDQTFTLYEEMADAGHCELIFIKDGEDFTSAVSLWEEVFFPLEPAEILVSPSVRAEYAWKALQTFPPEMKSELDISAVAEYAVDLADQMILELNRPKIQY